MKRRPRWDCDLGKLVFARDFAVEVLVHSRESQCSSLKDSQHNGGQRRVTFATHLEGVEEDIEAGTDVDGNWACFRIERVDDAQQGS